MTSRVAAAVAASPWEEGGAWVHTRARATNEVPWKIPCCCGVLAGEGAAERPFLLRHSVASGYLFPVLQSNQPKSRVVLCRSDGRKGTGNTKNTEYDKTFSLNYGKSSKYMHVASHISCEERNRYHLFHLSFAKPKRVKCAKGEVRYVARGYARRLHVGLCSSFSG